MFVQKPSKVQRFLNLFSSENYEYPLHCGLCFVFCGLWLKACGLVGLWARGFVGRRLTGGLD